MPKTVVTRITHSCHLIETGGRAFLTDPWFSTRPGYYQGEPIAIGIPDLPRLDGVLISHEHYDHCDLDAFAAYRDRTVPLFVAGTVVEAARKHGFTNVTALAPWQEAEVGGVTITATPAEHGVYEITFVLRAGSDAVYFAVDTLLIPELAEIPERLGYIQGLPGRPVDHPQRQEPAALPGRRARPGPRDERPHRRTRHQDRALTHDRHRGLPHREPRPRQPQGRRGGSGSPPDDRRSGRQARPGGQLPREDRRTRPRGAPGRFYLHEVYTDAAAFDAHLRTEHVHRFISAIPELSTGGPESLVLLDELPIDQPHHRPSRGRT